MALQDNQRYIEPPAIQVIHKEWREWGSLVADPAPSITLHETLGMKWQYNGTWYGGWVNVSNRNDAVLTLLFHVGLWALVTRFPILRYVLGGWRWALHLREGATGRALNAKG